jgi:hypothetical protein
VGLRFLPKGEAPGIAKTRALGLTRRGGGRGQIGGVVKKAGTEDGMAVGATDKLGTEKGNAAPNCQGIAAGMLASRGLERTQQSEHGGRGGHRQAVDTRKR